MEAASLEKSIQSVIPSSLLLTSVYLGSEHRQATHRGETRAIRNSLLCICCRQQTAWERQAAPPGCHLLPMAAVFGWGDTGGTAGSLWALQALGWGSQEPSGTSGSSSTTAPSAECPAETTPAGRAEKLPAEPDSSTGRGPLRWGVDN